jgi:hypothetical protein
VILYNAGPAMLFTVSFVEKGLQQPLPDGIMLVENVQKGVSSR